MEESEARFKVQEQQVEECKQACDGMSEAEIDEMLAESFPSSDPPSWTLGIDKRCEASKKQIEAKPMKALRSEPTPEFGVDCQHSDAAVCYPAVGVL